MERPLFLTGDSPSRLIQGAIAGAAAAMLIGFTWGGWMTTGGAQKKANAAVDVVVATVCADEFMALGPEIQAEYKGAEKYRQDDVIRAHIQKVGTSTLDYSLARACADMINGKVLAAANASRG